jgi:hypothetical protein
VRQSSSRIATCGCIATSPDFIGEIAIAGFERKGRIEVGADADLLLLRQDSLALATAIAGGRVHEYPA